MLIMAYNMIRTIAGGQAVEAPIPAPVAARGARLTRPAGHSQES